ncbi:hypothetical protein O181_097759 [Austropuccinia psidii MF-1]|uniref:Uncharacterized protein n=1 Tax=Austropuccinia psidii MF-1 TaxID=1389203 RepID=A0A9Q3J9H8_9BASI|nr:hypothetical protein [Austropuccinia psidii MF-1]
MTIVHKDENINKNSYGVRRWPLPNNIDNPANVPEEVSPQIPIEGISVTDLNTTFFEEVRNSYTQDKNCRALFQLLTKDSKDNSLIHDVTGAFGQKNKGGQALSNQGTRSEDSKIIKKIK